MSSTPTSSFTSGALLPRRVSRDDSLGGPHGSGDILDPRVAFSEGWANALSGLVLVIPTTRTPLERIKTAVSICRWKRVSFVGGQHYFRLVSEDSVGEIVTDLFDATNDAADADNVSLALTEMTKALVGDVKTSPVATTIFSLLAPVIAENASQSSQIDSLLSTTTSRLMARYRRLREQRVTSGERCD